MSKSYANSQMFALGQAPPELLEACGHWYRLKRVFKHDFFAATCLYELEPEPQNCPPAGQSAQPPLPRLVVKFGRREPFCGVSLAWVGRFNRDHEELIYGMLRGVKGIPRWAGRVVLDGYAIEYIEGVPLDHVQSPPPGYFDRLREVLDAMHKRGIAYGDGNKRSNLLIGPGGQPYIIDFQVTIRRRDELPILGRALARFVAYIQRKDLYHIYKHKRRMAPNELTPEEEAMSRWRSGWHGLHRTLTKPYRAWRRKFLQKRFEKGALTSPTAGLEYHHQPEKKTWRGRD